MRRDSVLTQDEPRVGQINCRISESEEARLIWLARFRGVSKSELLRPAIQELLEEERQIREGLQRAAAAS